MDVKYTSEQYSAINSLDKSMVVVAGAGAGKTRVLVDRIMNILKAGKASIDEIVAITYTEKAALELKDRIRTALQKEINYGNKGLLIEKEKLVNSNIGTIHQFCLNLLKENPVEAGIDTECSVLDNAQAWVLIDECLNEVVNIMLENEEVFRVVEKLGYEEFIQGLLFLYERLRNLGMSVDELTKYALGEEKQIIYEVLKAVDQTYKSKKEYLNLMDYEDMLRLTYEMLSKHDDILRYYQKTFKYVLVDEYQDLNYIQDYIIRLLSVNANLFVVGDKKQSIYRFRGARVELFDELYSDISKKGDSVALNVNFRSMPSILYYINGIFNDFMEYFTEMRPNREGKNEDTVEILLADGENIDEKKSAEAQLIAKRIGLLTQKEGYKYGDISIIINKRTHLNYYTAELEKYGIPYHVITDGGLLDCLEIRNIVNALKASAGMGIVYVYGTLVNLFDISDDVFAKIRLNRGEITMDTLEKWDDDKLQEALAVIKHWVNCVDLMSITDLVEMIIDDARIFSRCALKGRQSVANVFKFVKLCSRYDDMGYTIKDFLDELENFRDDEGEAVVTSEDNDVVKFITIHSAKGLEFPVVIFADTSSSFNTTYNGSLIFDPDVGLAISTDAAQYEAVQDKIKRDEEEEYKRLLYVALTRAKDKLIISGNKNYARRSFMNWIMEKLTDKVKIIEKIEEEILPAYPIHKDLKRPSFEKVDISVLKYFAVTELSDYLRCPFRYGLRVFLKIDERESNAAKGDEGGEISGSERGSIVHNIIDMAKSYKEALEMVEHLALCDCDRSIILKCVKNYFDSYFASCKKFKSEYSIEWTLDENNIITGRIDRLILDDEIVLLDFKTNVDIDSQLLEAYGFQLKVYAIALREKGINIHKAILFNLYNNELINVEVGEAELRKTETLVRKMVNEINGANSVEEFVKKDNCVNCGFKNYICR